MGQIISFLTKYKNYFLVGIVVLLLVGIFVGGFMYGKGRQEEKDLKAKETALKNDIKTQQQIVNSSTKSAVTLIDSAGIYESFARKQAQVTEKIHGQVVLIKNDTKTKINDIDKLSRDSNVVLFSKYAQDYIDSSQP